MEASWLLEKKEVWEKPFRLARGRKVGTIPVPGEARRDVVVEAGVFSQQMALPWQADFLDCAAGPVADPSVDGGQRRVGWWPMTRPDDVFPLDRPKERRPWARVPDPQTPVGYREIQSHNEMVNLWSTLGFVVETMTADAPKDLYETEFNKAPAAVLVAAAARPSAGRKRATEEKEKQESGAIGLTVTPIIFPHWRRMSLYDIAIAGAGPAGSVLALLAARAHYRVLLVEKSRFDRPRLGETAPPELRPVLTRVGLEHLLQAPFCRDAPGVLSVWGNDEPVARHHIFSPYGSAFHLDRRAFDEALAIAARDAGADLRLGCSARFVAQPSSGYIVQLSTGERVRSRLAILATGRAGGGLGLPYVRRYLDNNIAVAARFSSVTGQLDRRTVIEAVPGGWFYLAALPGNEFIAVFVTSATLIPSKRPCALALVARGLGTNHRCPQCVKRMSSPGDSFGGERARFICSIRWWRLLACGRRRAYRSRPAIRSRHHLGNRRRFLND